MWFKRTWSGGMWSPVQVCMWVCAGVYVLLTSVVLVDLLSVEKLSNSFGLVLLFQGIASLVGPPIAGDQKVAQSLAGLTTRFLLLFNPTCCTLETSIK